MLSRITKELPLAGLVGCLAFMISVFLLVVGMLIGSAKNVYPAEVPDCPLTVTDGCASVYMIAIYEHEHPGLPGQRYTYITPTQTLCPGNTATPGPYEGSPIGFEWYWSQPLFPKSLLTKQCGDTSKVYPHIFTDGFELGLLYWDEY